MAIISKALVGAVAAGAMVMIPAAASAQNRYDNHRRGGPSAGQVIAGAAVIGGIAAIAGAIGRNNNRYDNRYYRGGYNNGYPGYNSGYPGYNTGYPGYNNGVPGYYNGNAGYGRDPNGAIQQCASAATSDARSRGFGNAQVAQIRDVNNTSYGFKIRGLLMVDGSGYGYGGYGGYGRDSGSFTCWVDRGQVTRMDYSGIRGM